VIDEKQAAEIREALEREKRWLAEELHNGPCQSLCSLGMQLQVLERGIRLGTDPAQAVEDLKQAVDTSIAQLRALNEALRPGLSNAKDFQEAFKVLSSTRGGIIVETEGLFFKTCDCLSPPQLLVLYRTLQELLRICLQHSKSAKVTLRARMDKQELSLELRTETPECGIDQIGLEIIKAYLSAAGGELDLDPVGESSIQLTCRFRFFTGNG
jgi:signal transduction histidine kinase